MEPAAFTKVSALGVEEQRVNVVLDFAEPLDKVQTIGDGFRVEAHIVTFRAEDAIKAPVGALFRHGKDWAAFVVEDGRARLRSVKLARRNGAEAMVEGGLAPGETVVVYPSDALEDGARVTFRVGPVGLLWVAEHRDTIPGRQFRDVQIRGPFRHWEHVHRFLADGPDACFLLDEITYEFPLGWLGQMIAGKYVRRKLERLFDWRHRVTAEAFERGAESPRG